MTIFKHSFRYEMDMIWWACSVVCLSSLYRFYWSAIVWLFLLCGRWRRDHDSNSTMILWCFSTFFLIHSNSASHQSNLFCVHAMALSVWMHKVLWKRNLLCYNFLMQSRSGRILQNMISSGWSTREKLVDEGNVYSPSWEIETVLCDECEDEELYKERGGHCGKKSVSMGRKGIILW